MPVSLYQLSKPAPSFGLANHQSRGRSTSKHSLNPRGRETCRVSASFGENLINSLTVAINKSPINAAKIALSQAQAGSYDAAAIQAQIKSYIDANPVVVFSWTRCPFCVKAKGLLNDLNVKYQAVELDTMTEGMAIRAELAKMTERTSVPNVFIRGKSVGGCNDGPGIMTLHNKGELMPMLKNAGALGA